MAETLFVEGEDYPAQSFDADQTFVEDEAVKAARKAFGIKYLFPWQRLVVSNILDSAKAAENGELNGSERDDEICRGRQIVLLPTGAGKSLCFLTPALLLKGPTLVLYPLLALMADQQRRMEEGNLKCVIFKGGQSDEERQSNFQKLESGEARVILANPEVLQNRKLVEKLSTCGISHVAIDEAHCVSEWGDSFRPAYLTLGKILQDLKVPVITAFTATASPPVLSRVAEVLFQGSAHYVQAASDRPNIHYEVRYAYAKKKAVLQACIEFRKPLIVFCSSRRRTEDMARLLTSYFGEGKAKFYHAGMTKAEKNDVEKWFFDSEDGMLAATCAYGMGMDKGNIYTVIHLDAPEHMENFIQEAGRAGRKGDNVKSVLIWSHNDDIKYRQALEGSREKIMGGLAHTTGCRRQFMLNYLSGEQCFCSGCDVCDAQRSGKKLDYTAWDGKLMFDFIKKNRRLFTREEVIQQMTEVYNDKTRPVTKINCWDARDCQDVLGQLLSQGKIKRMGGLWEGRLDIEKKISRRKVSLAILHLLHHRRRRLRHLLLQLEQLGQNFS